jgi:hypothetical protein
MACWKSASTGRRRRTRADPRHVRSAAFAQIDADPTLRCTLLTGTGDFHARASTSAASRAK